METTTESLFATLGPEAREEALRLAARLQAHDGESAGIVQAARAAGIEDRFLREAVGRMATPPAQVSAPAVRPMPALTDARVSGLLLLGGVFARVHTSARSGVGFLAYALAFLLPFALAALAPGRPRWFAPAMVAVTGVIVHLLMRQSMGWAVFGNPSYFVRTIGIETLLATAGALVASRLGSSASPSERFSSSN